MLRASDPGLTLAGWLGRMTIALYARTCRLSIVAGREDFETARSGSKPVLVGIWHEHIPLMAPFLIYRLHRAGRPLAYLVSRSRDGELAVRMIRRWGLVAVRGSSSRGATAALRDLRRAVKDAALSPVMVLDGPRGPARQAKPGLAALGRMTGAPTLLVAAAARPAGRLRSWDRMVVPLPFARVWIAAELVPQDALKGDTVDARTAELEQRLEALRVKAVASSQWPVAGGQ